MTARARKLRSRMSFPPSRSSIVFSVMRSPLLLLPVGLVFLSSIIAQTCPRRPTGPTIAKQPLDRPLDSVLRCRMALGREKEKESAVQQRRVRANVEEKEEEDSASRSNARRSSRLRLNLEVETNRRGGRTSNWKTARDFFPRCPSFFFRRTRNAGSSRTKQKFLSCIHRHFKPSLANSFRLLSLIVMSVFAFFGFSRPTLYCAFFFFFFIVLHVRIPFSPIFLLLPSTVRVSEMLTSTQTLRFEIWTERRCGRAREKIPSRHPWALSRMKGAQIPCGR